MSTTAPYGSWESPVGAADTVADMVRFSDLQYDDGSLYWLESRPSEGGRNALVRRLGDGTIEEVLPATANVRTMAHEYGGAPYRIDRGISCTRSSPISDSFVLALTGRRHR